MENTEFKGTKGKITIRGNKLFVGDTYKSIATMHVVKNYEDITFKPITDVEQLANAELAAEAFNVVNETGYTPKQLAEQNMKLREIIAEFEGITPLSRHPKVLFDFKNAEQ